MTEFAYRQGRLYAEDVPLERIAASVGTPFYCYSSKALESRYQAFADALKGIDATISYALKANSNQAVIATFAGLGAGADVVSEGELRRALAAGVPAHKIYFAGVGKTRAEMEYALGVGIAEFNVESEPELELLSQLATSAGRTASVAVRVNPDVDAGTHAKITTGRKENKFGIDIDQARAVYGRARRLPGIKLMGISVHIGSQLTQLDPYRLAFARMADLALALKADGHPIEVLDCGGGLGVRYLSEQPPPISTYAALIGEAARKTGCRVVVEPGRALVAEAGVLVASVIYVKDGTAKSFVVIDAAMNDLIRPTLYEAYHEVVPVRQKAADSLERPVDIVGPICESGDYIAKDRAFPEVAAGELVAIKTAGAYGAVMASSYNTRLLAPEVMVRGGEFDVVRPRPSYDDLIGQDRVPAWIARSDDRLADDRHARERLVHLPKTGRTAKKGVA
ncbi:MAG: diaminopimelate decarboxylase [Proteobacteria bacterium]|nr:diaminopimelate decarboxylase [Pseudomonadota bacterium]MBI3499404.1 diaminopimelate decarboxylase [Pseudomonadota bacterium]